MQQATFGGSPTPDLLPITRRPPLSRDRLLEIALEAFEEGAARQREKRHAAGLEPVSALPGFYTLSPLFRAMLGQIIRADEDTAPPAQPLAEPDCTTCGGIRWLAQRHLPTYSPPLVRCPGCKDPDEAQRREVLAGRAGITREMRRKTFAAFKPAKGAELAIAAAGKWAREYAVTDDVDAPKWLVITGERGSGKTHLSLAAANLLIDGLRPVRWFYTADLVDMARSLYGDGKAEAAVLGFRRELAACPALVLDEFGALATTGTDWAVSRFVEPLIDQRYRESKPTLFTLKLGPEAVRAHISESIGRRMEDREICAVVANEARQWTGGRAA